MARTAVCPNCATAPPPPLCPHPRAVPPTIARLLGHGRSAGLVCEAAGGPAGGNEQHTGLLLHGGLAACAGVVAYRGDVQVCAQGWLQPNGGKCECVPRAFACMGASTVCAYWVCTCGGLPAGWRTQAFFLPPPWGRPGWPARLACCTVKCLPQCGTGHMCRPAAGNGACARRATRGPSPPPRYAGPCGRTVPADDDQHRCAGSSAPPLATCKRARATPGSLTPARRPPEPRPCASAAGMSAAGAG